MSKKNLHSQWFENKQVAEAYAEKVGGKVFDTDLVGGYTVQFYTDSPYRTVEQLTRDEIIELKERILDERNQENGEGVSWGEFTSVDEYVSNEEVAEYFEGTSFVDEDFWHNINECPWDKENDDVDYDEPDICD